MRASDPSPWADRRGCEQQPRRDDWRSPSERDYSRILHSAALRRLQGKTQVFGAGQHDFYRTRLTHSLEVAQIGVGLLTQLQHCYPNESLPLPEPRLIESLALAHDIGHPPFGHGGESVLNTLMQPYGGFEANAQTLRIVTQLEPYSEQHGMNLTRRTLLGLLKYPRLRAPDVPVDPVDSTPQHPLTLHKPLKALYQEEADCLAWILEPLSHPDQLRLTQSPEPSTRPVVLLLDCSILSLADDIAYGIHDLEDAIVLGLITPEQWQWIAEPLIQCGDPWLTQQLPLLTQQLFSGEHHQRKRAIGALVNRLISDVTLQPSSPPFESPLLALTASLTPPLQTALTLFMQLVDHFVIHNTLVQRLEYQGQQLIKRLFEAFNSDPERLLPEHSRQRWRLAAEQLGNPQRVIADYIAGMTDGFAQQIYQQLFIPTTTATTWAL
jgi:dGTPase